ncbi:MT-A70-domain-containing protein [Backusella circina FSU 941]|nr:MT-A70-domain-containing protein [Backusella circina FSU 941]
MSVSIIDTEKNFSTELYRLKPGDFDIKEPYFRPSKSAPTESNTKKRRKRNEPKQADIDTQKRHEELKPFLTACLAMLKWETKEILLHNKEEEDTIKEAIDFPTIQAMVQSAHLKFDQQDEEEEAPYHFETDCCKELDIFQIFNRVYINPTKKITLLEFNKDATYLLPPRSTFLMGSMQDSLKQLGSYVHSIGGADLIVMDPPWPNKSVYRSSQYGCQDIYDLFSIPIPDMLTPDSVVAIWVTNKPKFRHFILDKLLPAWKLKCVAEWIWLKVTVKGECVFPLDSSHKKPYEQLIIAKPVESESTIPKQHMMVSIPSKRHSRKPPLHDLLTKYVKKDPVCVELFARCLLPGWISWGNECLKFQQLDYFEKG